MANMHQHGSFEPGRCRAFPMRPCIATEYLIQEEDEILQSGSLSQSHKTHKVTYIFHEK